MGADNAVIANFWKETKRWIHSNQNIIPDFSAMNDGAMTHDYIVPDDDICHPRMDDRIILNAGIASNLNPETIGS